MSQKWEDRSKYSPHMGEKQRKKAFAAVQPRVEVAENTVFNQ